MSTTLSTLLQPLLEVTSDRLIHSDGQERLEYWSAFQKLWEIFPDKDVPYGQFYNRHMIGNILFIVTRAVERAAGNNVPALEGSFPHSSFDAWSQEDWEVFTQYFKATAANLKRMDALLDPTDASPEDPTPHPERANSLLLNEKVEKMVRYMKVHKISAPMRKDIMDQLKDKKRADDQFPDIPQDKVDEVWSAYQEEKDETVKDQFVRKIFQTSEDEEAAPQPCPNLRTLGELREAFGEKPFNFSRFDVRIDGLMVEWCDTLFDEPRLNPFYFPDEVTDQDPVQILNNLRDKRRTLRDTGLDPLEDTIRLAEAVADRPDTATARDPPDARRASTMYQRKKSAVQLRFDESEEEDVDSEDPTRERTRHLSKVPTPRGSPKRKRHSVGSEDGGDDTPSRKKSRKSQQKKYEGRRQWSDDEKNAIAEGIRKFGMGNWAKIKDHYNVLFSMRTSGQIKDCFRRLKRNGELPQDLLGDTE